MNKEKIREKVEKLFKRGFNKKEISIICKIDRNTVSKLLGDKAKRNNNRTNVETILFENTQDLNLNYFLGLLATDGNLSESSRIFLGLKNEDIDIIIKYKNFLGNKVNINRAKKILNNNIYYSNYISFRSKEIHSILNSYGITEHKSLTLNYKLPITWDFLRGVIDGDGSYIITAKKRFKINIISGSEIFINQLKDFLTVNNIDSKLYILQRKNKYFSLNIHKKVDVLNLINNLYKNNTDIFINRKYSIAMQIRNYLAKRLETQGSSVNNPEASQQFN